MKKTLKTLTLAVAPLFISLAAQANENRCVNVFAKGDKCSDLQVEFNFSSCKDKSGVHKAKLNCKKDKATATVEVAGTQYSTELKLFVGSTGNKVWDAVTSVQSQASQKREVASQMSRKAPKIVLRSKADDEAVKEDKKEEVKTTAAAVSAETTTPAPAPSQDPTPAPTAPVANSTTNTSDNSVQPAKEAVAATPEVKAFTPTWKNNALLQFWYTDDSSQSAATSRNNFRLRRAEVKFSGTVADDVRWYASLDFAKSLSTTATTVVTGASPTTTTSINQVNTKGDNKVIQDLGIGYKLNKYFEFIVGQFKTQTVSESFESSSDLLFPERSLLARTYGESRDAGVQLVYKNESVKATFMAANGQGPNVNDTDTDKDVSVRVDYAPWKDVTFGSFIQVKQSYYAKPERYGFNLGVKAGAYGLKIDNVTNITSGVRSEGSSVDLSYRFNEQYQLATRYEYLQPDKESEFKASATSVGLNYSILKNNSKIQLMHSTLHNLKGNFGSTSVKAGDKGSLIILGFQSSF